MTDEQRLMLFYEIKSNIIQIIKSVYDTVDHELDKNTVIMDEKKYVKAAMARLAIKGLRTMTLNHLDNMSPPSSINKKET
jgi:Na+-translocating ferredoxin:NAD+ oxidoreductase RnfC subunit